MSMYVTIANSYGRALSASASTDYSSARVIAFIWSSDNSHVSVSPYRTEASASVSGSGASANATAQLGFDGTGRKEATISVIAKAYNEDQTLLDESSNTYSWIEAP